MIIPISELTLKKIAEGEVSKIFDEELQTVRENISDRRTWSLTARKIVLEITIRPDVDRQKAVIYLSASSKCAKKTSAPQAIDLTNQQYFQEQGFFDIKEVPNA